MTNRPSLEITKWKCTGRLLGPDIKAVVEVKALILESVNAWKNYKKRMPSSSSAGVTRPSRGGQGLRNVYSHLSGLEDVVFNDFIKDDFISEGNGQATSGSTPLPDPVTLEKQEQRLESEQNERDVLNRSRGSKVSRMRVMF